MKIWITISLLIIAHHITAQLSLSAFVTHNKDGYMTNDSKLYNSSSGNLYLNDYYGIRCDYLLPEHPKLPHYPKVGFSAEFRYLRIHDLVTTEYQETYNGNPIYGPNVLYWRKYESKVHLDYLGLKTGLQLQFANVKSDNGIGYQLFIEPHFFWDRLLNHSETDQKSYIGEWDSNSGEIIYEEPNENTFNILSAKIDLLGGGLELRNRISYRNIFIDLYMYAGLSNQQRRTTLIHYEDTYNNQEDSGVLGVGIGIGYSFDTAAEQ